jgi:hypothetical protein
VDDGDSDDAEHGSQWGKEKRRGNNDTSRNSKSDSVAIDDPCKARNLTPATTKEAPDILTNGRNCF